MPIKIPDSPEIAQRLVLSVLHAVPLGPLLPQLEGTEKREDIAFELPMRVSFLSVDKILSGRDLRAISEPIGWQFLLRRGAGLPIAAIRIATVGDGGYRFEQINVGPVVEGTYLALQHAGTNPTFDALSYEPRLLLAPAIYVAALWLQGPDPESDWIMPIPPTTPAFTHFVPLRTDEFMTKVVPLAERIPRRDSIRGG